MDKALYWLSGAAFAGFTVKCFPVEQDTTAAIFLCVASMAAIKLARLSAPIVPQSLSKED